MSPLNVRAVVVERDEHINSGEGSIRAMCHLLAIEHWSGSASFCWVRDGLRLTLVDSLLQH